MDLKKGERIHPGLEDEVAVEQAMITVSSVVDAVVELVTNCDDSYLAIEQAGEVAHGKIDVVIQRAKGNSLVRLTVIDKAAGMSPKQVARVLVFGKKTSGVYEEKTVRGFLGRGLKESILAIGEGEIITVSDGVKTHGRYFFETGSGELAWDTIDIAETDETSGTTVTITPLSDRTVDCQTFGTLEKRIRDHFALSDILSNPERKVRLTVETVDQKKTEMDKPKLIRYEPPQGQQIVNEKLYLKGLGVAHLAIFESSDKLFYSAFNSRSQAGIRIRTQNAIFENQLFGHDSDPDAHHFFGEVRCPGIFESIRLREKGIIKPDRTGLNWKHKHCKELRGAVKEHLDHHIERRKEQARSRLRIGAMPKDRAARFKRLFRKLNQLSRGLLGEAGPGPDIESGKLSVSRLLIVPAEGGAPAGEGRAYTVYNTYASTKDNPAASIILDDPRGMFELYRSSVILKKHKKQKDLAIGHFNIKGFRKGDKTWIIAKHGSEEDYAEFVVRSKAESQRKPGKVPPTDRAGGLFKDVRFNNSESATQRTYYDNKSGCIDIFVNFPGISPFLRENGEGSETERGSILLAELIGEAFCRVTARRRVDTEGDSAEGRLDAYNNMYNEHLALCIPIIYKIWVA